MFVDDRPINANTPLAVTRAGFSNTALLQLYQKLLMPRVIENRMLSALRGGKISKWFSGYGQETISVTAAMAMQPDEYICTMHRNLGVFTTRNVPLERLFAQFMGKMEGFTKGRDRSFHFGSKAHHLVGMISHLGPQLGVADGIALHHKLREEEKAVLVFCGDGATSEGDFHEAVNVAAVWKLPVVIVVENNYWGLSTPYTQQYACKQFIDKAAGYGIEAVQLDGNNPTEMLRNFNSITQQVREKQEPILVECMSFRMRGHEEASGTAYYPEGLAENWEQRDGIAALKSLLIQENIAGEEELTALETHYSDTVKTAFKKAQTYPTVQPKLVDELTDVYAPASIDSVESAADTEEQRMIDALNEALHLAMQKHRSLVLMGQDIADYGGVFKATEGLLKRFGAGRVRNTPLCESAILGTALGLSVAGSKAMVEMQFADFVSCGITQICNNLAKIHYRWGQHADVVIRMPTGAGVAAGPFHSQSNEAWFTKVPGLKVYYPSNAVDAKGLLLRAFEDPNPVLFFEHKKLYRSNKEQVPQGYYTTPEGKAVEVLPGEKLAIITYGMGVHWARELAKKHPENTLAVVDLRTLVPLDWETVFEVVNRCSKAIVLQEDTQSFGVASELVARIQQECFYRLDAPVVKVGSLDTPVPFAAELEQQFLPQQRLEESVDRLLAQ